MAKIIRLFADSTSRSSPSRVKRALSLCGCACASLLFIFGLPFALIGFGSLFVVLRVFRKLTGEYPFSFTLRLGDPAEFPSD